jgi:hypothetical protein
MPSRLALKRLTRSDLTLFEAKYRTVNVGGQKSINLNADVFISVLYPSVPAIAPTTDNEIRLGLSIVGPGGKPAHRLTRKIIKNPSYKNWRLNGEFIPNPEEDPTRYNLLQPNDLVVMAFDGDPAPDFLRLCLISQTAPADAALHTQLFPLLGNRSMIPITPDVLQAAAGPANTPPGHPIESFIFDEEIETALEDAALGGETGVRTLMRRASGRRISVADLAEARANHDRIGRDGEGLINAFFELGTAIATWMADTNAVSPYDFQVVDEAGEIAKIDVKSTSGPFDNNFHISIAELVEAAQAPERYDLYRVYELDPDGGKLRIARDIREFARSILDVLTLPEGVRCDSFTVSVSAPGLVWEDEMYVLRPSGDDEELAVPIPDDKSDEANPPPPAPGP